MMLLADNQPRSMTWMLSGSFNVAPVSPEAAPAPRAFPHDSSSTTQRFHPACDNSLRTGRWPGPCDRCCCRAKRHRPAAARHSRSCVEFGRQRPRHFRSRLAAELPADELPGTEELGEIDAGLDAKAIEHVHHVLGRDVAGRTLGVRAAAEAGDRAVEGLHARLERGVDVRERLPVSIVVMA